MSVGVLYFRLRLHRIRLPRWVRPRVRYGVLGFGTVVAFLIVVVR